MSQRASRTLRGLALLAGFAALLWAAPAWAQRAPVLVTDRDVDNMIQDLSERLLSLQSDKWIIRVHTRAQRQGEPAAEVPVKEFTGELVAREDGGVAFKLDTGKIIKVPGEFIVRLVEPAKKGDFANLTYRTRRPHRKEPLAKVPTKAVRGQIIKQEPAVWAFKTDDGQKLTIPQELTIALHGPGHFDTKLTFAHGGGVTALATLALLKAGQSPTNPKMKMALDYLRGYEMQDEWPRGAAGTYATSLRANVWEHLITHDQDEGNRTGYRRLLEDDAGYLEDGMSNTGWYSYGTPYDYATGEPRKDHAGDHSNTQFGVLGMWAAATGRLETDKDYWKLVYAHWMKFQRPDGGWQYTNAADGSWAEQGSITMTTAGLNSLFLVLDLYHARSMGAYVRFAGIAPDPRAAEDANRVFKAIDKGLGWMSRNLRPMGAGYGLYGLERLGVASGLKRIGGHDWYREGIDEVYQHRESLQNMDAVTGSFTLLFLAYGRAPVIYNKLATSDPDWNYYFRDLHYMCRFLTGAFERIYKWQTVRVDGPELEEDLADAPITYLAGTKKPKLTDDQLAKLKAYLEAGGTLVLHATRRSREFADGAKQVFEQLFKDRGYEFEKLPDNHPVYSIAFGKSRSLSSLELEGMSDGARMFIILIPKDIAGAWQQNLEESQRDLFEAMAKIRIYAAPGYFELPSRLRPTKPVGPAAPVKGVLRVARIEHRGQWNANPTMWTELNKSLTHGTGLTVQLAEKAVGLKDAGELANVDLLQLVGHGSFALTADQLGVLSEWLKGGGMLLMDKSGGQEAFGKSAEQLYGELRRSTGGMADLVGTDHVLAAGGVAGMKPLGRAVYNRWGLSESVSGGGPNLKTLKVGGRDAVLYSPLDVSATVNGDFLYEVPAYKVEYAKQLVENILLLRWSQLHPAPKPPTPAP